MIPTKEMTKAVPIQTDEIIEQVTEAADIGVNMVHIHARDPNTGEPTYKKEIYGEIIGGIKKKHKDLVLCVSLSGRTFPELEKRSEPLDLTGDVKPDFGSLTLSSLNFPKQASINSPEMVQALAKKMLDKGIRPELEAFDLGMVNYAHYLINKKLVKPPYYFNLILGNIASAQSNLMTFGLMVNELPKDSIWSGGGIGKFQLSMNAMSIIAGGGVRIGLEDNIYFDEEKTHLATNKELIERLLLIAKALGRTPYSHKETREVLGLN